MPEKTPLPITNPAPDNQAAPIPGRNEQGVNKQFERHKEKAEVKEVFAEYGLSKATQDIIADEMAKDTTKWVNFMMKYELGLEKPDANRARNSAATIGISYIIGGLIPLCGYFFTQTPSQGLMISSLLTIISLFVFGYFKSKVTGQDPIYGAFKVTLIGVLAAAAAFGVAKFFDGVM